MTPRFEMLESRFCLDGGVSMGPLPIVSLPCPPLLGTPGYVSPQGILTTLPDLDPGSPVDTTPPMILNPTGSFPTTNPSIQLA